MVPFCKSYFFAFLVAPKVAWANFIDCDHFFCERLISIRYLQIVANVDLLYLISLGAR